MLAVARIAAIQAVKKTSEWIPLAHGGVAVEGCVVRVEPVGDSSHSESDSHPHSNARTAKSPSTSSSIPAPEEQRMMEEEETASRLSEPVGLYGGVRICVRVETTAKTGVEMEALTGVVGAALTVVDMCKGVDKGCVVDDVRVVGKKGGRSGGLGVWRERVDEGSKGVGGPLKEGDGEGFEKRSTESADEAVKLVLGNEDLVEGTDNERVRKGKMWKKWTPDLGGEV